MRSSLLRIVASLSLAWSVLASASPVLGQSEEVVIGADLRPARLEVPVGATVTWRNTDGERHRMRSRTGPEDFDSGNLEPGQSFSFTFGVAGTYPYLDERDDEDAAYMGLIVVVANDAAPSAQPPGELPLAASVSLIDESFQPASVEVATGGTLTWSNDDGDDSHTVTSDDGAFDSGILEGGETFSHTFTTPGTYPYACLIHPEMRGTVIVSGAAPVSPVPLDAVTSIAPSTPSTAAASPAASAPSSPAASPAASSSSAAAEVHLAGRAFAPADVSVPSGSTVRWLNDDGEVHTVSTTDGAFDSGILSAGSEFEHTFDTPGTYAYFCAIHPEMQGTVTVTE
jgi:plastocyanin